MSSTTADGHQIKIIGQRAHKLSTQVRILPGASLNHAVLGGAMRRKGTGLVLCTLLQEKTKRGSQAQREREAKEYWDGLTLEQEAWALRKMGFFEMGSLATPRRQSDQDRTR
jgi:hypothetical protein